MKRYLYIFLLASLLTSCNTASTPRPYSYYRIDIQEYTYIKWHESGYPYSFEISTLAVVDTAIEKDGAYWMDILYPQFNARIHCTYSPVNGNLRELSDDSEKFIYNHAIMANAIPEQEFEFREKNVYGIYYDLAGNTASTAQFYMTDSVHNYFRAALYFFNEPNEDSIAPVSEVIRRDMHHFIETFSWE